MPQSSRLQGRTAPKLNGDAAAVFETYAFLLAGAMDAETLARAIATAEHWGVAPHAALIALGWVTEADYTRALARQLQVPAWSTGDSEANLHGRVVISSLSQSPATIALAVARAAASGRQVVLAGTAAIEAREGPLRAADRLHLATHALLVERPELSAAAPVRTWQIVAIVGLIGLTLGGLIVDPALTAAALSALAAVPFLVIVGLRALAFSIIAVNPPRPPATPPVRIPDAELPVYTVLAALHDEAAAISGLAEALGRLDYPAAKLDIILALESDDAATIAAAEALELPGNVRIVRVPSAQPRTKPKALNYALQLARGSYVVIYDAEDVPEPGQLRWALDAFRNGPAELACVQAHLNIHNWNESWLARGIMAQTPLEVNPASP